MKLALNSIGKLIEAYDVSVSDADKLDAMGKVTT